MNSKYTRLNLLTFLIMVLSFLGAECIYAVDATLPEHKAVKEMLQKKEFEKARKAVMQLTAKNDMYGNFVAGLMYMGYWGVTADLPKGIKFLTKAADQGDSDAQIVLGGVLLDGHKSVRDEKKALVYLNRSAAQNNPAALESLGMVFENGMAGMRKDPKKARQYYLRAANLGRLPAQRLLGIMLFDGSGGKADKKSGLVWLNRSASAGDGFAHFTLGYIYENGFNGKKDLVKAAENYLLATEVPAGATSIDRLKKSMTASQFEEAQKRAAAWKKSPPWKEGGTQTTVAAAPAKAPASGNSSKTSPSKNTGTTSARSQSSSAAAAAELDPGNVSGWPQPQKIPDVKQIEQMMLQDYFAD